MYGDLLQFGILLAAITAIAGVAWLLGFRQTAALSSVDEASELFRLAPGGFEPVEIGLDNAGACAIARDAAGRRGVLLPHGSQFVFRLLTPGSEAWAEDGALHIASLPGLHIRLGDAAEGWATTDSDANSG